MDRNKNSESRGPILTAMRAVCLSLLLMIIGLFVFKLWHDNVEVSKFEYVQVGMDLEEIERILGKPTYVSTMDHILNAREIKKEPHLETLAPWFPDARLMDHTDDRLVVYSRGLKSELDLLVSPKNIVLAKSVSTND